MKTRNTILILLCSLFLLSATGQNDETPANKKIRISLIKDIDGKKNVIEKEFSSEEELAQFIKSNKGEFPVPPVPPVPPLPSMQSDDYKPYYGKACNKKEVFIETEVKCDTTKGDIIIRTFGKDGELLTEDIKKELNDMDGIEEKIIIIRKSKRAKDVLEEVPSGKVTEQGPAVPSNINELSFYPNPTKGKFHIKFRVNEPADAVLQLTDINGKVVYSEELKDFSGLYEKDIYRSELSSGTYFMHVIANGEKQTLKISVQK